MSDQRRFGYNECGTLEWVTPTPNITAGGPNLNVSHYRIRDDDISSPNSTPTWLGNQDSNPTASIGTGTANSFVLRVQYDETNNKSSTWSSLQLNYDYDSGTATGTVGPSSSYVRMYGATSRGGISDDAAITTARLTAPTGTFDNGVCDTATGSTSYSTGSNGAWTEHEYIVYIVDADVADGKTVQLSITGQDATGVTWPVITISKPAASTWDQDSFQVFNPGTESGATAKRSANTNWTQRPNSRFHIRFLVQETSGGSASLTLRLESNKNGGGWNAVTGASSNVVMEADTNLTEGADTTQRIGAGTFLTNNNWVDDNDGVTAASGTFAGNDEAEALFSCYIVEADVANSDSIQLRVAESDGTALDTYTNTPTITVLKEGPYELNDPLTLTDSMSRDVDNLRLLLDSLTLTDTTARTIEFRRLLADALTLTDSLTPTRIRRIYRYFRRMGRM